MKRYPIILTALLCLCLLPGVPARSDDAEKKGAEKKITVSWESVEGSIGYQVEIRDAAGKTVFSQRVTVTELQLLLAPGQYRMRVGAVNKFHKIEEWSDWTDLIVKIPVYPVFSGVEKAYGFIGRREKVTVEGKNLVRGTKVFLVKGDKRIEGERILYDSEEKLQCEFNLADVPEGDYDLVLENPDGFRDVASRRYGVRRPVYPEFVSLSESRLLVGLERGDLVLKGRNLKDAEFFFTKGDVKIRPLRVRHEGDEAIRFDLDLRRTPDGTYVLIMENKEGFVTEQKDALVLMIPVPPVIESLSRKELLSGQWERDLMLTGKNFKKEARVELRKGNKVLEGRNVRCDFDSIMHFDADLTSAEEGPYVLEVINPDGARGGKSGLIQVKKPSFIKEALKGTPESPGRMLGIKAGLHIAYVHVMPDWNGYLKDSFQSIGLMAGADFAAFGGLRNIPVIRNMGLELEFAHDTYKTRQDFGGATGTLDCSRFGTTLFYTLDRLKPVYINGKLGGGLAVTRLALPWSVQELNSRDPFYQIGLTAEIRPFRHFFAETGLFYQMVDYLSQDLKTVQVMLRCGVRF